VSSGQVSIETLLIGLFILIMGMAVLSYYTTIQDSTTAMELVKVAALNKISSVEESYSIEKIDYAVSGTEVTLCIYFKPDGLTFTGEEELKIKQSIVDATSFETVRINPTTCPELR